MDVSWVSRVVSWERCLIWSSLPNQIFESWIRGNFLASIGRIFQKMPHTSRLDWTLNISYIKANQTMLIVSKLNYELIRTTCKTRSYFVAVCNRNHCSTSELYFYRNFVHSSVLTFRYYPYPTRIYRENLLSVLPIRNAESCSYRNRPRNNLFVRRRLATR